MPSHSTLPPPARARFRLVVNTGQRSEVFSLHDDSAIDVGRDPGNVIRIEDPSVSRRHLEVYASDSGALVVDLGSSNGTLLLRSPGSEEDAGPSTAHRLPPNQPVPMRIGESLRVGPALIVLQLEPRTSQSQLAAMRGKGPPVLIDPEMKQVYQLLSRAAQSEVSVLILGETGVGKEMMAETVHLRSRRAHRPYLQLNCAALPETLLESELFGHEKGAFTGAHAVKAGLLESTQGGTVFLDEIGELGLGTQAKLLRVLEERTLLRVGGTRSRHIDVRFVTATNRDLLRESREGRFRSDLYYRIGGLVVRIPPLRERPSEIAPLARHFLAQFSRALEQPEPRLSSEALEALLTHDWPGNVRELRNVIERAALLAGSETIRVEHVLLDAAPSAPPLESEPDALTQVVDRALLSRPARGAPPSNSQASAPPSSAGSEDERARLIAALDACAGNQTRAAELLGISRRQLINRVQRYGLPRPKKR